MQQHQPQRLGGLRAFVLVAETEHLAEAADLLAVPQSTLSRRLTRLEADLGRLLFDRGGRRLRLTPVGRSYLPFAQRALEALDAGARALAAEDDPDGGLLRLGFLNSLGPWLVPRLLRQYRQIAPAAQFQLRQSVAGDLRTQLLDDRLDVILTAPRPAGVQWQPLIRQELVIACAPEHPVLSARTPDGTLRLEDLAEHTLLTLSPHHGMQTLVDGLLADAGIAPRATVEGTDLPTLSGLAAAGLGVAIIPADEAHASGNGTDIVQSSIAGVDAHRVIGIGIRPDAVPSAALRRFWSFLTAQFPSMAPDVRHEPVEE